MGNKVSVNPHSIAVFRISIFQVVMVARVTGRQVGVGVAEKGVEIRLCNAELGP